MINSNKKQIFGTLFFALNIFFGKSINAMTNSKNLANFSANLPLLSKFAPKITASPIPAPLVSIPALYTETQAHLSIQKIREMMNNFYPHYLSSKVASGEIESLSPYNSQTIFSSPFSIADPFSPNFGPLYKYRNIINTCLTREIQYKDTHYVFYHAQDYRLRIIQDLNMALCVQQNKCPQGLDFVFLRTFDKNFYNLGDINTWMNNKFQEYQNHKLIDHNLVFNNDPGVKPYVLATNLALFGNIGRRDSNTFKFFIKSQTGDPLPFGLIANFALSPYIKNTVQKAHLVTVLSLLGQDSAADSQVRVSNPAEFKNTINKEATIYTQEGQLIQVFIPKNIVDETVFLTKEHGNFWPYKVGDIASWSNTLNRYTKISPMLETYVNKPDKLTEIFLDPSGNKNGPAGITPGFQNIFIDRLEGRILLRGEIFNEPTKNNVIMYRYTTLDAKRESEYQKRINIIAKYILEQAQICT